MGVNALLCHSSGFVVFWSKVGFVNSLWKAEVSTLDKVVSSNLIAVKSNANAVYCPSVNTFLVAPRLLDCALPNKPLKRKAPLD